MGIPYWVFPIGGLCYPAPGAIFLTLAQPDAGAVGRDIRGSPVGGRKRARNGRVAFYI